MPDLGLVPVFAEVVVKVYVHVGGVEVLVTLTQLILLVNHHVFLFELIVKVPDDPEADPNVTLVGDTFKYGAPAVYVQYKENL
jgi:hypothetical protein